MSVSSRIQVVGLFVIQTLVAGAVTYSAPAVQDKAAEVEVPAATPVLKGRIVDEGGKPVTDASLRLSGSGRRPLSARTDQDGNYSFVPVQRPNVPAASGLYRLRIESKKWVGEKNYQKLRKVQITPGKTVTLDLVLRRAAEVRIQVVDENEQPVPRVSVYYKSIKQRYGTDSVRADATGLATIGGLDPSDGQYLFGCKPDDFGFGRVTMKVSEAKSYDAKVMTLEKGRTVKGSAMCSDGLPPAGWKFQALPSWWDFGTYPSSCLTEIAEDGTFQVTHAVDGDYRMAISVPRNGGSTSYNVGVSNLLKSEPVKVKMNYPSPASMGSLSGTIEVSGGKLKKGLWLQANSMKGRYHESTRLEPGAETFEIKQLPKGLYRIQIAGDTIETVNLTDVKVPSDDVKIMLKVRGPLQLAGRVLLPDGTPAKDFRVSVVKLRTLGGAPNYVHEADWHEFSDKNGAFKSDLKTPGIYQVTAIAEGFAPTISRKFNTTTEKGPLEVVLKRGVSLSGVVVDESGKPVAGVTVKAASLANGRDYRRPSNFGSDEGALKTDEQGRFEFSNLPAGKEKLQATLSGYAATLVEDLDLSQTPEEPLKITLSKGATIRGLVYDGNGKRAPGKVLHFQDSQHGGDYEQGLLAKVASNERGFFQAANLTPGKITYIVTGDEWRGSGVARRAVLAADKQRTTVMFGGPKPTTGRLLINGKPAADTMIQLGGEDGNFGIMKALARTDREGRFRAYGPPPGVWTFHYQVEGPRNEWMSIRKMEIGAAPEDLGDIDFVTGPLTVQIESDNGFDGKLIRLARVHPVYDAIWKTVGTVRELEEGGRRFVIDDVPDGEFELVLSKSNYDIQTRKRINLKPGSARKPIQVRIDKGTASVRGKAEESIVQPGGILRLWHEDGCNVVDVQVKDDGTFHVENLRAGEWLVRKSYLRNDAPLLRFKIAEGEKKQLSLTKDTVGELPKKPVSAAIEVFTPDGALTPCHVRLSVDGKTFEPASISLGVAVFGVPAGTYKATISLKGFKTSTHNVDVQSSPQGKPVKPIRLTLERSKE